MYSESMAAEAVDKKTQSFLGSLGIEDNNPGTFAGKWLSPSKNEKISSISPLDGKPIANVITTSSEEYEKVIKHSTRTFEEWADIPAPKRGYIIMKIGNALRKNKVNLGRLVTIEAGKTKTEGEGEIQEMIDISDFAVGLSRQLYGLVIASERPDHRMLEQYLPLGPIGLITSFNFPSSVWSWNSFIAAVCGDTSIWKPSSKTPLTAIAIMKIVSKVLEENSVPQIFSLVTGSGETIGSMMAEDPRIKLISFTGSVRSGKIVSNKVANRFGKMILELGGNNAAVVTANADIDLAVKGVAFGALATAGQRCTSTRRVIVDNRIYSKFVSKLKSVFDSVSIGNPVKKDVLVGPLIDKSAVSNFLTAISEAKKQGGKLLAGGSVYDEMKDGFYVRPALIEARPDMEICKKETFAPILYVFRSTGIEEAVEIHNSVPQGLSSSIFTTDLRESEYFLSHRGSDCGIVNVNTGTAGAEIGGAFGGEKETGGGRESGSDAWKSYMRRQTVTINYGRTLPLSQGVEFEI